MPSRSEPVDANTACEIASADEFARLLWQQLCAHSGWHTHLATRLEPLAQALMRTPATQLLAPDHPWQSLLAQLHTLLLGYYPELGRTAERLPEAIIDLLHSNLRDGADNWAQTLVALTALAGSEQSRQQRIEQRLIDAAHGQWRSQRARQQAAQLLNRSMAGKQLAPVIVGWLQGEWFNELQWCLLHHGDAGSAWQRRAQLTLALIASLQPPNNDTAARQQLYAQIPEVTAELRAVLGERTHSAEALEDTLARIEQQHLLLLKGRTPETPPHKLIATEQLWFADISLSRELLARIEDLTPGQWFVLREDCERRAKLVLKQPEAGELLFVNQLGIKVLQVSIEEFAYRLGADVATALPGSEFIARALADTRAELTDRQQAAAQIRSEEEAALMQRQRVEHEALLRAQARAKATAEAHLLAAEQACAAAADARLAAEETERRRQLELARRREVRARQSGDEALQQRQARLEIATLSIGQWIEMHDDTGHLQRLKLAVKLPTMDKLIFVDREGIRRADLSRAQLIDHLLEGSARIAGQDAQFEDTLARVVDGLRRHRDREA